MVHDIQYMNELAVTQSKPHGLGSRTSFIFTFSFHLSTSGGLGPTATILLKQISSMIFDSQDEASFSRAVLALLQNWFYIDMFCCHEYL